jgi:hypothetical protein
MSMGMAVMMMMVMMPGLMCRLLTRGCHASFLFEFLHASCMERSGFCTSGLDACMGEKFDDRLQVFLRAFGGSR